MPKAAVFARRALLYVAIPLGCGGGPWPWAVRVGVRVRVRVRVRARARARARATVIVRARVRVRVHGGEDVHLCAQGLDRVDQLDVSAPARDVLRAKQAVREQQHLDRAAFRRGRHGLQSVGHAVGRAREQLEEIMEGRHLRRGACVREARGGLRGVEHLVRGRMTP